MNHVVKQADCVLSVAKTYGLSWETIWNHPNNATLKQLRHGDPSVLLPGDELFIPDIRKREVDAAVDRVHKFVVKNARAQVRLRLLDFKQRPRAMQRYSASVDGVASNGSTDADGYIRLNVPVDAREVSVRVLDIPRDESYTLSLGHIDPHDTTSGVQQRLTNLGYPCLSETGTVGTATQAALRAFQKDRGLAQSADVDDATRSALRDLHGC